MTPREEWLLMSTMLLPPVFASQPEDVARDSSQFAVDLHKNVQLTRRAVMMGVALSAIDGPLPVMDIVAFVGVSAYTTVLWARFYSDYR